MKPAYYISILLLLMLIACDTTKKSVTSTAVSSDTLVQQATQQSDISHGRNTYKEKTDTAVGIAAQAVEGSIKKQDTEIPRTKDGKAVPRHFEKKVNGLSAWVDIDTNGNVKYGAKSDSLTLVIKGLTRSYDSLFNIQQHKKADTFYRVRTQYSSIESTIRKIRTAWWFNYLLIVIGCIAFVLIAIWALKKFTKPWM
ncbi:MAG: hypothetical protein ACK4EY_15145 [Flavipsychrobacter sp.]